MSAATHPATTCRLAPGRPRGAGLRLRMTRAVGWVLVGAALWPAAACVHAETPASALQTATALAQPASPLYTADGSVEAVRESRIAAQVPGRITEVAVRAGDRVPAGAVLVRIDPSVANEQVAASRAQVAQAQALLATARADFTRAQRLHAKQYLSDAAYERAEAQYKAAQAQARALSAQAAATGAQADFFTLRAPYAGWVSRVDAVAGDLATPGRVLVTVYDPQSLRVSASVPESVATLVDTSRPASVSVPGVDAAALSTAPVTVLPGLDAQTHTAIVRAVVPSAEAAAHGLVPGQFARVEIPLRSGSPRAAAAVITVPQAAVVRRGELDAVYVVDAQGHPELRQVRLGRTHGDRVEIQAGVSAGERVALDPVAAARASQP